MVDTMYFGYSYEDESKSLENDFIECMKNKFENVELKDAYDEIKGYRQNVYLDDNQRDNYLIWLIGDGWLEMSLTMQLMMMDKEKKDEFLRLFNLAKEQYPEAFKQE